MRRKSWIALLVLVVAPGGSWGCGDSGDSGPVQRSEATLKSDAQSQDGMKAFMQSKKGSKKR